MKKKITLIILVTFCNIIFSQNKKINLGIVTGMNYSSLLNDNSNEIPIDYDGRVGFLIGGFISINITKTLSIQPELIFSMQGGNFSIDPNNIFSDGDPNPPIIELGDIDGKINESMILLPVIGNLRFNEKIEMQIGPQLGYSVFREIKYNTEIMNIQGVFFKLSPDSKKIELGAILGFGYYFSRKIKVGIRYAYGITKRQDVNTSVFSLGLHYKI